MYSDLEEIIHQLKSRTSLLDNIPNKLFKSVSRCFTNHIINSSLQTGIFPVSLRCAVITLLLSKNNLESLVMIMEAFLIFHSSKYLKKMFTNNRMNAFQITAFMMSTNQGSDLIIAQKQLLLKSSMTCRSTVTHRELQFYFCLISLLLLTLLIVTF